ncbi:timeless protein-domain-containing protein [Lasiosphaeria hispida]|uniref:Topoisomerase 1-associated factor 1 n=1 Tax=Lasiosphaeria hispida TaxID=260671 RepID=A0AAJ0HQ86_9PEZI|nr:timeless protein-domain-containing protein [Lasiosphaeria hispida]
MEATEAVNNDVVHPEVRAHINSLVSALGGMSVDDDESYRLGDDALEVLRDLKRWIRFYDEKTNRMDVARCLAEANIVGGDLLHILATWPPNCADNLYKSRIALACFEVIVPLTWPIEKDRETMTVNHHRHMPVLQLAQLGYKRAIINYDAAPILSTAVRVALPSMAMSIGDRAPRDQGIIKLILFFLRNIAMISPPPGVKYDGDETQVSRSTLIDAFSYQDIFLTLLTIASNMGDDFRTEDVIVMEIIFHLVKRVDSSKLFVSEKEVNKAHVDELAAAMNKEAAMLRSYNKNAPTRHSRFGTMIWVKRESGKLSTVTGQDALLDPAARERKMDKSKTFKPPRKNRKEEMEPKDLGPRVSLDERGRRQLGSFVSDFLDSGFNPLFGHVRKSLDREAPHVLDDHQGQFFYLTAWFLEAERMRRKSKQGTKPSPTDDDVGSFNLVAEVLSQEMLITLNRFLERSCGDKDWQLLAAVMRCLTQILLTVQEMSDSGNEEDEEIADNILSRLFYEETTHDAIANIARTYKDQGFEYLDASTDLVHTFLRILEAYSKQNVDLQVRSRKRTRRKKKATAAADGQEEDEGGADAEDDSADDERNAEKTSQERKFDFKRFANRFVSQGVVDAFVAFTKFYRDLNDSQLKRAHRYFYRVAFKQDMSVMLFRLDIIHLFYNMIKGPEPLDRSSAVYKDWEELAKQIIKKCVRKLEERPALFTEILFSKINSTAHYLEYGYEKQTVSSNPRPGVELEFKREISHDQQVAVAVGVLLDKSQTEYLQWIKTQLSNAASERLAWENAEKALIEAGRPDGETSADSSEDVVHKDAPHISVRPEDDACRTAMFKNPHLRLLMKLVGMERLTPSMDESPDSTWVIPGTVTADALKDSIDLINKAEFDPPTFDGESTEDQLRRKSAARKRVAYDDDDNGFDALVDDGDGDIDALFPAGGPTARKSTAEESRPKKRLRRHKRDNSQEPEGPTEEELNKKARARREKELEKARKIKSDMYVHASDDESDFEKDREFFARERSRQEAKNAKFGLPGKGMVTDEPDGEGEAMQKSKKPQKKPKKRTLEAPVESSKDDDDSSSSSETSAPRPSPKRRKKPVKKLAEISDTDDDNSDDDDNGDDVMASTQSSHTATADDRRKSDADTATDRMSLSSSSSQTADRGDKARPILKTVVEVDRNKGEDVDMEDDDEDDDLVAAPVRARPRAKGGFIIDSSDEE